MTDSQQTVRFLAPDGSTWMVYEITEARDAAPARALIFASDTAFRRVRRYPAEWSALPADDLWLLSWKR